MLEPNYVLGVFQECLRVASVEADRMRAPGTALPSALVATIERLIDEERRDIQFRMRGWRAG